MRILLVEDDDNEAALVEAALERATGPDAPELRRARTLQEALQAIATSPPDVVLLDISLPDSMGLAGLQRVRRSHPATTIVMRTGLRDDALALEALSHGAQDYLVKGEHSASLLWRSLRHAVARNRAPGASPTPSRERVLIEAEAAMLRGMQSDARRGTGRRAFRPGTQLGARYVLSRLIAEGSSSHVYSAQDLTTGTEVCVKHVRSGTVELSAADLSREIRLSASFEHPRIVRILDFGTVWGEPYIVMECAKGGALSLELERGPLAATRARAVMLDVLEGLEYLHANDTLHLDLKPANVVLDAEGRAKITDFGISLPALGHGPQETQSGLGGPRIFGTPAYVAPEIVSGEPATPAADIFSAGALLYHLLTGRPYVDLAGLDLFAMRTAIREHVPSRAAPGGALLDVAIRALAKDRKRRYSSAQEMRVAVDAAGASLGKARTVPIDAQERAHPSAHERSSS